MWRHNDVIGRNEYLIYTLSESTFPWVYSQQFLFKSTHPSWRYETKCEWVFFFLNTLYLPGTCTRLSIWKYLNTQASIWVFKYYLNTELCRVFRKVFKYFTHGICPTHCLQLNKPTLFPGRLNQGSFVLLCFELIVLLWVAFNLFILWIFTLFSVLYYPAWTNVNGTV